MMYEMKKPTTNFIATADAGVMSFIPEEGNRGTGLGWAGCEDKAIHIRILN